MQEDPSGKQEAPQGPAIDPKHDPLVIAAVNGHLDVVKQLEALNLDWLCGACAAAEASKKNQTAIVQHVAKASGRSVLHVSVAGLQQRWLCACKLVFVSLVKPSKDTLP